MIRVELDYYADYLMDHDGWLNRGVLDMSRLLMKVARKKYGGDAFPMFRPGKAFFSITGVEMEVAERIINDFVASVNADGYEMKVIIKYKNPYGSS